MSKPTIVCVDDEEIILRSLGEQLKRSLGRDCNLELASSGEAALELCAELSAAGNIIAVIISDQQMIGMSGDELLVILHAYYPQARKILLTGQAEASSVGNVVNATALYRYIEKPWDETDLILTVKEALHSYGQEQQILQQNNLLKHTNQKLIKSLNLLLAVFQTANDGILVLDNQDEVIIFNQLFASLWRIDPNSIEGNSKLIYSSMLRRLAQPPVSNLEQRDRPHPRYNLLKLTNGKILESYFQIQQLNGKIVGKVWGFRDVTARERDKAQQLTINN